MRWKTLGARVLYEESDHICIFDNYIYRWLTFGNRTFQTMVNRWHLSSPSLYYIKPFIRAAQILPGDICMLGLGGAGVAHALSPFLNEKKLTTIEIDESVIAIASQFFWADQIKNMEIIHEDALSFLRTENKKYAHLLIDIHGKSSFPEKAATPLFFKNVHERLKDDGIMVLNLATIPDQEKIIPMIREIFNDKTISIPVKRSANLITVAVKNAQSPFEVFQKIFNIKEMIRHPLFGNIAFL